MAKFLDWKKSDDVRDIVHLCVQALAEGHLIALPSCNCYYALASGTSAHSAGKLLHFAEQSAKQIPALFNNSSVESKSISLGSIVVRGPSELLDYSPQACETALRLTNRIWPGPVQLLTPAGHDDSLLYRLPQDAISLVTNTAKFVATALPGHPAISEIHRMSAGPLLLAPIYSQAGELAVTADVADNSALSIVVDGGMTKYSGRATILQITQNQCEIVQGGTSSLAELQSESRLVVLLVCTGNTCRSPMAEKLLEQKLQQRLASLNKADSSTGGKHTDDLPFSPIVALSAGIASAGNGPASPQAVTAMSDIGLDLTQHQSCAVTEKEIDTADLILAMTRGHMQAIISRWPTAADKTFLLSGNGQDVIDPFGGPVEVYRDCAKILNQYLDTWLDQLFESPLPYWSERNL